MLRLILYLIQGWDLEPKCVTWNFTTELWEGTYCEADLRRSTNGKTVCRCHHLTNFGIIFGVGEADDLVLSLISIVFGVISVACLLITIFFLHWLK